MMRSLVLAILFLPVAGRANVVGVDAQNFNPTTNGLDFVTVHSSKTLSPGVFNLGLFFNYAINTLPNYENTSSNTRFEPEDALTSMDFNLGIGLMNNWDIGISIPQVLSQSVDKTSTPFFGQFEQTGINEIRVNSKYRLWDGTYQGLAVIASANFFLIEDYPFVGSDPGPTYNLELAYDHMVNKFTWAVNAGYRFRNPGDPIPGIPVTPIGDQVIASAAVSYYFENLDFKLIGEVFGSMPTDKDSNGSDRELSTAEVLFGAKWDFLYNMAGHFGIGTAILDGTASPDVRAYAGLNWTFGPLFSSEEPPPPSDYYIDVTTEETYEEKSFTYIDDKNAFTAEPKAEETFLAKNILFEFNGHQVNPEFHEHLKGLADYLLKGNGFEQLVIIGHTDSVGSESYNLALSQRRANAVKEAIVSYLPPEHQGKVRSEGAGESSPIASNSNYQGRSLNRRVEFFIKRKVGVAGAVQPPPQAAPPPSATPTPAPTNSSDVSKPETAPDAPKGRAPVPKSWTKPAKPAAPPKSPTPLKPSKPK